jgi:hypothetical protein
MTDTVNLGLPFIEASQAQKHVTHNESLRILDALIMLAVKDRDLSAPPVSPAEGDRYLVKAPGTGAFAGHDDHIAAYADGGWTFYAPRAGWLAYVEDEGVLAAWDGAAWSGIGGGGGGPITELQELTRLGLGTTADATNPLSATLNNVLWSALTVADGGDGHLRYKMSKESAAKTLSLLFQDNFSGRAEIGLTGDDDFHFKTSPDGSTWIDAMTLDKTTGAVRLNSALFLTGDVSPTQITANQNDYNPAGFASASVLRISTDASRNLTGLYGGVDGRIVAIVNAGSNNLVLVAESASSMAANRFAFGADVTLTAKQSALLIYDSTDNRWRLLSGPQEAVGGNAGRERLTDNRTYYVRSDGSDSNNGLGNNSGGAFLTLQKAWNTILTLDLNGFSVTVQIGDGTYTGGLNISSAPIGGNVTIRGNNTTPANVAINTSGNAIFNSAPGFQLTLRDFKLQSSGGDAIAGTNNSYTSISNLVFGATSGAHVRMGTGATLSIDGNYTIAGSAQAHWIAEIGGKINGNTKTITLSGTPAFTWFANVATSGILNFYSPMFSGSATGQRYLVSAGGIVNLYGAGTSALPGNTAGSGGTASGGGFYG